MSDHHYSQKSLDRLGRAHPDLRKLFMRVGPRFPNAILETDRSVEQQRRNVEKGVSKTMDSKHIVGEKRELADAVDAAPDPLEWPDVAKVQRRITEMLGRHLSGEQQVELTALIEKYAKDLGRWYYFGGYVCGVADELGIAVRWGGDWDGDREIRDQSFNDLPHVERVD